MSNIVDTYPLGVRPARWDNDNGCSQVDYPLWKAGVRHPFQELGHVICHLRYPPSTSMFPLSQSGGTRPTSDIEAPAGGLFGHYQQCKHKRLTNEPPSITSLMYLHSRCRDVRCIAEEGKPHIFDMQVVKCFVKRAVELVPLKKYRLVTSSKDWGVNIRLCKPRGGM